MRWTCSASRFLHHFLHPGPGVTCLKDPGMHDDAGRGTVYLSCFRSVRLSSGAWLISVRYRPRFAGLSGGFGEPEYFPPGRDQCAGTGSPTDSSTWASSVPATPGSGSPDGLAPAFSGCRTWPYQQRPHSGSRSGPKRRASRSSGVAKVDGDGNPCHGAAAEPRADRFGGRD